MKRLFFIFFGGLLLNNIQITQAADIAAGKKKAALCASCHGADGMS